MRDADNHRKKIALKISICAIVFLALIAMCLTLYLIKHDQKNENYSLSSVNIAGQVETDGALSVVDQRTITLKEGTKVLTEKIYRPTNISSISVESVRFISKEDVEQTNASVILFNKKRNYTALEKNYRQKRLEGIAELGVYSYDGVSGNLYLTLPDGFDYSKEYVVEATYYVTNSLFVYDDVAELYWDYLPETSQHFFVSLFEDNENVSVNATLNFPIPEGQNAVFNDNVFAWGHGDEGSLEFLDGGGIEAKSELTSKTITSRLHLILPKSWLSSVNNDSAIKAGGARKSYALEEEKNWTDSSTIKKANSFTLSSLFCAFAGAVLLICFVFYATQYVRFKKLIGQSSPSDKFDFDDMSKKISVFDTRAQLRQTRFLGLAVVMLLFGIAVILFFKDAVSFIAFVVCSLVILIFANWTPSFKTNYRDKLKNSSFKN